MVYELSQGEHRCTWDPDYPEHPGRLLSVLARCDNANDDNDDNNDDDDGDDDDNDDDNDDDDNDDDGDNDDDDSRLHFPVYVSYCAAQPAMDRRLKQLRC